MGWNGACEITATRSRSAAARRPAAEVVVRSWRTGVCGLVEDADVIVHTLDPEGTVHRDLLAAIGEHRPDVPLVVEVAGSAELRSGASPARAVPVRYPMTTDSVVAAVREVWPGA